MTTENKALSTAPSEGDRFRVTSAVAAMHGDPRISSAWVSQLLSGQVVQLLESQGDWLLVRGEDSYEGWVHRGYLAASTGDELQWRVSLGCRVSVSEIAGVGTRIGGDVGTRALPLLARISPSARVVDGEFVDATDQTVRFPSTADAICRSAASLYIGASYVWGGVSPWGCDCSGFTQSIFRLHGVSLPRDASHQAVAFGALDRDTPVESLAPGTLAFFTDRDDRHVTHVGIMLGNARMAHSGLSRGGFNIESLVDQQDEYVARLRANYVGGVGVV